MNFVYMNIAATLSPVLQGREGYKSNKYTEVDEDEQNLFCTNRNKKSSK